MYPYELLGKDRAPRVVSPAICTPMNCWERTEHHVRCHLRYVPLWIARKGPSATCGVTCDMYPHELLGKDRAPRVVSPAICTPTDCWERTERHVWCHLRYVPLRTAGKGLSTTYGVTCDMYPYELLGKDRAPRAVSPAICTPMNCWERTERHVWCHLRYVPLWIAGKGPSATCGVTCDMYPYELLGKDRAPRTVSPAIWTPTQSWYVTT